MKEDLSRRIIIAMTSMAHSALQIKRFQKVLSFITGIFVHPPIIFDKHGGVLFFADISVGCLNKLF